MSLNFERRKEVFVKIVQYVSQEYNLPSKIKKENGSIFIQIGKCKSENDCYGKYDIEGLVDKYSIIDDDNIWIEQMYQMIRSFTEDAIEDHKDPDYSKKVLTTFEKHNKYYMEKCPRSQYWHETSPDDEELIRTYIDGVDCPWSIGSDRKSTLIKRALLDNLNLDEAKTLEHLEERWKKDLEYHVNEVRFFTTNAIVGMNSFRGYVITSARMDKSPYMVKVFHGPRIFELMTNPESCKAVLNFLNLKIDKLTVFGLTQDLCFIEETNKKEELVTDEWDRELLGRLVLDPNRFKRFSVFLEHQGTSFDLTNVNPLNIPLRKYNSNYYIETPICNTVYSKDGNILTFG